MFGCCYFAAEGRAEFLRIGLGKGLRLKAAPAEFLRTGETFAAEGRAEFLGLCPWVKKGRGGDW